MCRQALRRVTTKCAFPGDRTRISAVQSNIANIAHPRDAYQAINVPHLHSNASAVEFSDT
jgi:hypothetical protein